MRFVVTVCDSCQAVALVVALDPGADLPPCESCDASLRVVPGRTFHERERTTFQLLSVAVTAGDLSSWEASNLSARVARALSDGTYVECWEELSNRLPALISWEQVLGGNAQAHENVLQLVRTILEALATCRGSGVLPTPAGVQEAVDDVRRADTPKKSR